MATTPLRRRRVVRALTSALATVAAASSAQAATATTGQPPQQQVLGHACSAPPAYGWPVRPFDRPHPVRAVFGDPRIPFNYESPERSFHSGIDVVAADGTAVYATVSGRVYHDADHPQVLWVGTLGVQIFGYWHVVPSVSAGSYAVARQTVIGHVAAPWGHVHLTESEGGVLVNPLRPGALGPYGDDVAPTIKELELERSGRAVPASQARGRVDLVAELYDGLTMPVPAPWTGMPVMPAVVRWRVLGRRGVVVPWSTALDFRRTIPPASELPRVYAVWTRQNHPDHPGRYRVYLGHGLDTRGLADGSYRVQVRAADTCGNRSTATFTLGVDNAGSASVADRTAAP